MVVSTWSGFNPRARVGRDAELALDSFVIEFQSTRPCGARPYLPFHKVKYTLFQSTRPCGARRMIPEDMPDPLCFNPRARVGRDIPSSRLQSTD